jgi:tRNA (uracil-5-)-methyltransferase TRM9
MSRSQKLAQLNRHFYQTVAESFSSTRQTAWIGFSKCLEWIKSTDTILDLGCGNGRFATFLREHNKLGHYTGVDSSAELLDHTPKLTNTTWVHSDIKEWTSTNTNHFDSITLFGVLHHVSDEQELLDLLDYIYHHTTTLILSRWNCIMNESLMSRRVDPESELGTSILKPFEITSDHWEPMEFLLDWKRGTQAYRYVRYWTDTELAALFTKRGFVIKQTWLNDGKSETENSYFVLQKIDATTRTTVTN